MILFVLGLSLQQGWVDAGGWTLVFRQTLGTYLSSIEDWKSHRADEDRCSGDFSELTRLENYRLSDGSFKFKLVWPGSSYSDQIWRQTSNPLTKTGGGVDGYEALDAPHTIHFWGGLEYSGTYALLDGSVSTLYPQGDPWFYAVGARVRYGGAGQHPGPHGGVDTTELYVWQEGTAGYDAIDRTARDTGRGMTFVSTYEIPSDGTLTKFRIFCFRADEVTLSVWRPDGGLAYTRVGAVTAPATVGSNEISASIVVQAGDVLGWYAPGVQPIKFTNGQGSTVRRSYNYNAGSTSVSMSRHSNGWTRKYSIQAEITASSQCGGDAQGDPHVHNIDGDVEHLASVGSHTLLRIQ